MLIVWSVPKILVEKIISLVLNDRYHSFMQTVNFKYTPSTCSIFFCKENVLCSSTHCKVFYKMFIFWRFQKILVKKNYISGFVCNKSFIQIVKYSIFSQWIVYQGVCDAMLTFISFSFSRKVLCFTMFASCFLGSCVLYIKIMLSFSFVCSLKMGLLKCLSPVLTDRKQ